MQATPIPKRFKVISVASKHLEQAKVAERQADSAIQVLESHAYKVEQVKTHYYPSYSIGSSILLYHANHNHYIGCSSLGEKGVPAESIGKQTAINYINATKQPVNVDPYLSDQVLIPAFLKHVPASFLVKEFTSHAKTNLWVLKQFFQQQTWHVEQVNEKYLFKLQ